MYTNTIKHNKGNYSIALGLKIISTKNMWNMNLIKYNLFHCI